PSILPARFSNPVLAAVPGRLWKGHASLTEETTELILPSRLEAINQAAEAAADFVRRSGLGEDAAYGVDMAVREAVNNAVLHGTRRDESKAVEVSFRSTPGEIEITVRDCGEG